jgi:hypothetical protein
MKHTVALLAFIAAKICYYDCLGSVFAITIDGLKLCPLNIRR